MPEDIKEGILPLVEEEAHVGKRERVTGRIRVHTTTDEREELVRTTLDEEVVEVERVAVDRTVDEVPEIRTEGDVTIIPVVEEVLVVEKRLVLKEEVHVRRRRSSETLAVPVTLRRQSAVVERQDEEAEPAKS